MGTRPIPHHKNLNPKDNRISNLALVCPNCHDKIHQREKKVRKKVVGVKSTEIILLPDKVEMTKLDISNDFLTREYMQALSQATVKYHDAKLNSFSILVYPFSETGSGVNIFFDFYSQWADKMCKFIFQDDTGQTTPRSRDEPADFDFQRTIITELPWDANPHWLQFLDRVYEKIKPLHQDPNTSYHISASADRLHPWAARFEDGVTGKKYRFKWDGKTIDDQGIKQI